MATYRFNFPTPIHFGLGVRKLVPEHLKTVGVKRPLLVTDRGIAGLPMYLEMLADLKVGGLSAKGFSEIWGNPVKSQVNAGVTAFQAHQSDAIIGLGGGAALDVAKAIALMVNHPGDLFDYEDDLIGALPIDKPIPYFIALPTTAGTGSEVGRSAVISDDHTHLKKIIFSPRLLASTVFADPELTVGLPRHITAATGIDALTHCVEAYLAKGFHPICDGIAIEGLRQAKTYLVRAVNNSHDLDARGGMLMSSMMGAIAFQKGLGVTHSCAHALGAVVDMHHGLANGVMIDYALKHNISAVPDRFKILAETVGLKNSDPLSFIQWLSQLKKEVGISANLIHAGVSKDKLEALVEVAIKDGCHASNPQVCKREDFIAIFKEAFLE